MNRRKRSLWELFCISGIPWAIISFIILLCCIFKKVNVQNTKLAAFFSLIVWLLVFTKNTCFLKSSKKIGLFTWLEKNDHIPPQESPYRHEAQHPPIDPMYLSKKPDGLVVGYDVTTKRYVRYPIKKGHARSAIIIGVPGSGKSTLLLSSIIYQMFFEDSPDDRQTFFLLDPKPELRRKGTPKDDSLIRELSIQDRKQYGWDPYYNIRNLVRDDDILSELDVIARALIDAGKNEKNEFFYESARTIFKYVAFSDIKDNLSFMETMDHITGTAIDELINEVLKLSESRPELRKVRHALSGYANKGSVEAMQGIELAFRQSLEVFQKDDTRFFLDLNPRKVSPLTLEDHISIAFTISTTKIKENKALLRLVVMQLIQHCEGRNEDTSHMITMIIDEAYRLGLINWIDFLSVCRSKQVSCVLAFQSLDQMKSVWSSTDAEVLLEMVSIIEVLSCASSNTAKMICSWVDEYFEAKVSYNYGSRNNGHSLAFESRSILKPSDLMKLRSTGEAIVLLDGIYYRVSVEKARYYNIPKFYKVSKMCENLQ